MRLDEKTIRNTSLLVSVLIHALLFVKFSNIQIGSQAQAPKIDARISLNLLPAQKPEQLVEKIQELPRPEAESLRPKEQKEIQQSQQQQAVAPKQSKQVQRQAARAAKRERYLARLLTHIESFKYYPRAARQRGIEGSIRVSFRLLPDGGIRDLTTEGGPLILRSAAKGAVKKALPLPACPPEVECPMLVSYAMQFQLR